MVYRISVYGRYARYLDHDDVRYVTVHAIQSNEYVRCLSG